MEASTAVHHALQTSYERLSGHDPAGFAEMIATGPAVSVIGTAPGVRRRGRGPTG